MSSKITLDLRMKQKAKVGQFISVLGMTGLPRNEVNTLGVISSEKVEA